MSATTLQDAIINIFRSDSALDAEFSTTLSGTFTSEVTSITGSNTAFTSELNIGDYIGDITHGYRKITAITDDTHLTIASSFSSEYVTEVIKRSDINKGMSDKLNLTEIGKALRVILYLTDDDNENAAGSRIMVGYGFVLAFGFYEPNIEKTDERISFYDALIRNVVDLNSTFGDTCEGNTKMGRMVPNENFDVQGVYEGKIPLMCYRHETLGNR